MEGSGDGPISGIISAFTCRNGRKIEQHQSRLHECEETVLVTRLWLSVVTVLTRIDDKWSVEKQEIREVVISLYGEMRADSLSFEVAAVITTPVGIQFCSKNITLNSLVQMVWDKYQSKTEN
jgi:hypothetical protein